MLGNTQCENILHQNYCAYVIWCEDGEQVGQWFCFPLIEERIREKAEIPDGESFEINDWTLPLEWENGIALEEANRLYERIIGKQ